MPARRARSRAPPIPEQPDGPFTLDQLAEYKETFEIFDRDKDGKVTFHEMEALVNAVGFQGQESEVDRICSRIDKTGANKFTFEEFLEVAEHFYKMINMEEILTTCFKVFFGDDKRAKVDTVREILMGIGNPLTDPELKQMFWNLDPEGDDYFETSELVKLLIGKKDDDGDEG
jgi:Ca2+-binding EF-hand superfamily protein